MLPPARAMSPSHVIHYRRRFQGYKGPRAEKLEIPNPKHEIRNKSKNPKGKIPNSGVPRWSFLPIRICFEFRASDFGFIVLCGFQPSIAIGQPKDQNGLDLLVQFVEIPQQFIVPIVQFRQQLEFVSVLFHEMPIFDYISKTGPGRSFPGLARFLRRILRVFSHEDGRDCSRISPPIRNHRAFLANRPAPRGLLRNGDQGVQLCHKNGKKLRMFRQKQPFQVKKLDHIGGKEARKEDGRKENGAWFNLRAVWVTL